MDKDTVTSKNEWPFQPAKSPLGREVTCDGYEVIPDRPRGMQCGRCGMRVEYGKAYGYCCPHGGCPLGFN
jgi:hypothetical protein